MNIYDNGSKIYPDLNPTAPQEPQAYRLKKMTEVEAYLLDEIEERRQQTKKKRNDSSIQAFASSVGLPVGAALGSLSVVLSLSTIGDGDIDGDISPTEFHKVLQEVEKYRKLKADIGNLAKAK